jgi:cobalt-precorrin 5A hydrolase
MAGGAMIVAGIGCTSRATLAEMRALLEQMTRGRAPARIACLEGRAHMLAPLAQALDLPLVPLPRAALRGISTPTTSGRVMAEFGTGSVAEACALAGAGTGAAIVALRQTSDAGQATCALAEGMTE